MLIVILSIICTFAGIRLVNKTVGQRQQEKISESQAALQMAAAGWFVTIILVATGKEVLATFAIAACIILFWLVATSAIKGIATRKLVVIMTGSLLGFYLVTLPVRLVLLTG